jgi:hypothetical protein
MYATERELLGGDESLPDGAESGLALYDTHCETVGCANGEFTIRVTAMASEPNVICGGCGNPITDTVCVEERNQ